MITQEELQSLKDAWYTFEEIESIKLWLKNIDEWKTISENKFWWKVYNKINSKMKNHA